MGISETVGVRFIGDGKGMIGVVRTTRKEVDRAAKSMNAASRSAKKMGAASKLAGNSMRLFSGIMGVGVVGALGLAIKRTAEFEKKMLEVSTLLDDTSGLDSMTASVKELASQFGPSSIEQASALYSIISAGAASAAEATDTLTVANKLALGGVTDIETAADGLTSIMNAYAGQVGDATEISDALFVAVKAGKTTIGELSESIGDAAPIAAQLGVSLDELLASTATLTKGGISTAQAFTSLTGILAAVAKPTAKARAEAERLGLDFSTTALKAKGFVKFMEDVKEATEGNIDSMAQLFGRLEGLKGALVITGSGASDLADNMVKMNEKAGETEIAANKLKVALDFKWKTFIADVDNLSISIGLKLKNAILALAELLGGVNATIAEFTGLENKASIEAALWALMTGDVTKAANELNTVVKNLFSSTDELTEKTKTLTDNMDSFGAVMMAVHGGTVTMGEALNRLELEKTAQDALDNAAAFDEWKKSAEEAGKAAAKMAKDAKKEWDDWVKTAEKAGAELLQQKKDVVDYIALLEDELILMRLGNDEREKEEAVRKAGAMATVEQKEKIRELIGEIQAETKALEESIDMIEQWEKIFDNAVENMQRAFGELIYDALWEDGKKSFEDFAETLLDIWKKMIDEMIAAWLTSGIMGLLAGQGFAGFNIGALGGGGGGKGITALFGGGGGTKIIAGGPLKGTTGFGGQSVASSGGGGAIQSGAIVAGPGAQVIAGDVVVTALPETAPIVGEALSGTGVAGFTGGGVGAVGAGALPGGVSSATYTGLIAGKTGGVGVGAGSGAGAGAGLAAVAVPAAAFVAGVMVSEKLFPNKTPAQVIKEAFEEGVTSTIGGVDIFGKSAVQPVLAEGAGGDLKDFIKGQGGGAAEHEGLGTILTGISGKDVDNVHIQTMLEQYKELQIIIPEIAAASEQAFASMGVGADEVANALKDGIVDGAEQAALGIGQLGPITADQFSQIVAAVDSGALSLEGLQGKTALTRDEMKLLGEIGVLSMDAIKDEGSRTSITLENDFSRAGGVIKSTMQGAAQAASGALASAAGNMTGQLNNVTSAARTAASAVSSIGSFGSGGNLNPNRFAEGGVVRSPTFALIGERGPEAVIPLKNGKVPIDLPDNSGPRLVVNNDSNKTMDELLAETKRMRESLDDMAAGMRGI